MKKRVNNPRKVISDHSQNNKNKKSRKVVNESTVSNRFLLPLALVLAVIPLVVLIYRYTTDLEKYPWYSSGGGELYDVMQFYKGFFLTLIAGVIVFMLAYNRAKRKISLLGGRRDLSPVIAVLLFAVMSLISAILSGHKSDAFLGGFEHFEGCLVLISYCVCFYFAFGFARTEKLLQYLLDSLLIGSTVIGFLGTIEIFDISWNASQTILNILVFLSPGINSEGTVSAPLGMSMATLANPNYVGSYVALALPFSLYLIFRGRKRWRRTLAGITSVLLLVTLYGSHSEAGLVGVVAGAGVGVFFLLPYMKRVFQVAVIVLGAIAIVGGGYIFVSHEIKVCESKGRQEQAIENVKNEKNTLTIKTSNGKTLLVEAKNTDMAYQFFGFQLPLQEVLSVSDKDTGKALTLSYESQKVSSESTEGGTVMIDSDIPAAVDGTDDEAVIPDNESSATINEEGYPSLSFFYEIGTAAAEETSDGVERQFLLLNVVDGEKKLPFILMGDGTLKFYSELGWTDDIRFVKRFGFKGLEDFASGRGYIWSRTLPLLPDYLIIGAGADNFPYVYPNDDYVGDTYVHSFSTISNKPHNMFLQIWVQDGLIALLAFLFLYGLFMVRAIRMAFRGSGGKSRKDRDASAGDFAKQDGKETSVGEVEANGTSDSVLDATENPNHWWNGPLTAKGVATMAAIATTAYLVSGLANDSIVCVAPVYWVMLGVGYAAEAVVHRENTNRAAGILVNNK